MSAWLGATYRITAASRAEAEARVRDIRIEQTVEFPEDLIQDPFIRLEILGRVESLEPSGEGWLARIAFNTDTVGPVDLPQLLNLVFGNISLKPGIRLERLDLPPMGFSGPRFGIAGLRTFFDAPTRPLLCTALKPMGLSPLALADLAGCFARGGIDIVKDDHGLANQPFCPFEERVKACAAAVTRANRETGSCCLYAPNITGPAPTFMDRARFARDAGAGALLVAPGLQGWDAVRALAADNSLALPILFHPALLGTYLVRPHQGISHYVLLGQLVRLVGADAVIFPSFGGRFSFTPEECRDLVQGTRVPMGTIQPILPMPAGGMKLEGVGDLRDFYGSDVMFLIGGDLHRHGNIEATCRRFREMVERA